jgi:hypothetical protein
MKIRFAIPAIVVLCALLFAQIALAQAVKFNQVILCNGEHERVSSCFDDSDAAKCMVMYPDRPLRGGFTEQDVENRGDVIKKIKSCMGPNATLASSGNPAPAAPRTAPAPAAMAAAAPKANTPPPPPDPSVAKAHAAGVDMTALGLQLGQGFSMPQCPQVSIGDVMGAIFGGSSGPPPVYPCSQGQVSQPYSFGLTLDQGIEIAPASCPNWVTPSPCAVSALVRNGLLLGVYLYTTGQTGDPAVSAALVAKYGKPTQQIPVTFKNLYNYSAQFTKLVWTLPGLYVEYDPFTTDINQGQIYIETETGHQLRAAAQQTQQLAQPKL